MQGYDPYSSDPEAMLAAMGPFLAVAMLIGLAFFVFYIFCWWKIFANSAGGRFLRRPAIAARFR
jgi:hypothetical protein